MKALKALLLLPCLCLINAYSASGENFPTSLDANNLRSLLDRPLLSKENASTVLSFYKTTTDSSIEHDLAEKVLLKNKALILEDLIKSQLHRNIKDDASKKLLLTIGDDSFFTLAKIFAESTNEDQVIIGSLFKEILQEKPSLREVSECGVKEYNSKEDILCGVKLYNIARGPVCGAEYNSGSDRSCPGSRNEQRRRCSRSPRSDFEANGNECTTEYIYPPATCVAERFGVKQYNECENKSFGVAHYNTCAREEFLPKIFNACEIRKTKNEVELFIQSRSSDLNLNGSLLFLNQGLLTKLSGSSQKLACLIQKYKGNSLAGDITTDLISSFEIFTGEIYSEKFATNCEQTTNSLDDLNCSPDSKSELCKTKRSILAANKYFKQNLKELCLLSLDKVAQNDPAIKERLTELTEQFVEYVR